MTTRAFEKTHKTFRMTRQGVRWRFYRLFNQVYVEAFLTILMIEKTFGTQLREYAIRISKETYAMRQDIHKKGFQAERLFFGLSDRNVGRLDSQKY